jgi:hypothetical protein
MEGLGLTGSGGIEEIRRWCLQTPAWNLRSLAASWARERRGKGRGGHGLLIAAGMRRLSQGVKELKRGGRGYWERSPAAFLVQAWRRLRPDEGALPVSERKEGDRVPVREWLLGCGLESLLGRNLSPGVQIHFLFVFLLFSFLFPFFFYSDFSSWVLKSFSYSDLNEIRADQKWSFKSVFRN